MMGIGKKGGAGEANALQALIALGIIMMTPKVAAIIKKQLGVEEGINLGGAIIGGIMAGPRFITSIPQTGYDLAQKLGYMGIGPMSHLGPQAQSPPSPGEKK